MKNKNLSRKDFVKCLAGFFFGATALNLKQLFAPRHSHSKPSSLKEAKYYKRASHLAG